MPDHVIVWDLETVPDISGYAAANALTGKSDEEIREALGNQFPKHIYHSIVCIGALVAHKERHHWAVEALGAPHVGERPEKELIASVRRPHRAADAAARDVQWKIRLTFPSCAIVR